MRFDPAGWEDFLFWLGSDRASARRITRLIAEIQRTPFTGIGKPEPLKGCLSGYWSRRIDDEHRLVYRFHAAYLAARFAGRSGSPDARPMRLIE